MAIISGKEAKLSIGVTSTWGTEVTADKLIAFDTFNFNKSVAVVDDQSANGLGEVMLSEQSRGAVTCTPQITMKIRSGSGWEYFLACLMGTSPAPTEQNPSQGDYKHVITMKDSFPDKFLTLAILDSSGTTTVYNSVMVTQMDISIPNAPGSMVATFSLLANDENRESVTNRSTIISGVSAPSTTPMIWQTDSDLQFNEESAGALGTGDCVSILSAGLTISRPAQIINEAGCGTASSPSDNGLLDGSFTFTQKGMEDHAYLDAADDATRSKFLLNAESTKQIGTGDNHTVAFFSPKAGIIEQPSRDFTGVGFNDFGVNFKLFKAATAPAGMNSEYPYFEITNEIATSLLA